jgi:hypothetical protein
MNYSLKIILIILTLICFDFRLYTYEFKVIRDPKPNLFEKNFKELKKVAEICDKIGKGEMLYLPGSIAMDSKNNLYIYDKMQAKILVVDDSFKFVKSFGRVGEGPGEFFGKGKGYPVFINIGLIGNLYANDIRRNKVLVFNREGEFIRQFRFITSAGVTFLKPTSDDKGNVILQEFRKDRLVVYNEKNVILFSLLHKDKVKEILFKEDKPLPARYDTKSFDRLMPFFYGLDEIIMKLTYDSKLLLFFTYSSTMIFVNLKTKESKTFRIWPKEALEYRKKMVIKFDYGYAYLFSRLFLDKDRDGVFYLHFGRRKDSSMNCIYKMNFKGELLGIMFITVKDPHFYPRFLLKQNNFYFAKEGEKIIIYREE